MASVPGFLLRRLYVKGSLKNADGGFEFELKNSLGSDSAHKMEPLVLDGVELPTESTYFTLDGREMAFSEVSRENTFTLAMQKTITIWVDRVSLDPGPHKIQMGFEVHGVGAMRFDFTDVVADG